MTRRYFVSRERPPRKTYPRKPKRKPVVLAVTRGLVDGHERVRGLTAGQARLAMAQRKGGLTIQDRKLAHRWASEEARAAALKSWRKHGRHRRFHGGLGEPIRLGRKLAKATALTENAKVLLRARYALRPQRGIRYNPSMRQWERFHLATNGGYTVAFTDRVISERQALRVLGHLPSVKGYIPDAVLKTFTRGMGGTVPARSETETESPLTHSERTDT